MVLFEQIFPAPTMNLNYMTLWKDTKFTVTLKLVASTRTRNAGSTSETFLQTFIAEPLPSEMPLEEKLQSRVKKVLLQKVKHYIDKEFKPPWKNIIDKFKDD